MSAPSRDKEKTLLSAENFFSALSARREKGKSADPDRALLDDSTSDSSDSFSDESDEKRKHNNKSRHGNYDKTLDTNKEKASSSSSEGFREPESLAGNKLSEADNSDTKKCINDQTSDDAAKPNFTGNLDLSQISPESKKPELNLNLNNTPRRTV